MAVSTEPTQVTQTHRPVFTASGMASFLDRNSATESFNSAILTLNNFLTHLCDSNQPITAGLINQFFNRALLFNEWQANFNDLQVQTIVAIKNFCDATGFHFSFADLLEPSQIQIVPLMQKKVKQRVIEKFLEGELEGAGQFRLFDDKNNRTIAVIKLGNGAVRAISFPNFAAIIESEVVPLCTEFGLAYRSNLEFEIGTVQQLELNLQTQARFRVTNTHIDLPQDQRPNITGVIVRGPTFEPIKVLRHTSLISEAELFYPVKHLEQFFIDRNSDPIYLELITSLSRAIDSVLLDEPEAVPFAQTVLERARFAFEQIFPDDKPLEVQVQSLERALAVENLWPKAPKLQIELD